MAKLREIVEVCPHCMHENTYMLSDRDIQLLHGRVQCQECGKKSCSAVSVLEDIASFSPTALSSWRTRNDRRTGSSREAGSQVHEIHA